MTNDDLVLDNKGLVYLVIKNMGITYNLQEFYEVGEIGLIKASQIYNKNLGCKFSTYATKYIHNELCNYIIYKKREKRYRTKYKEISLFEKKEEDLTLLEMMDIGIDIEEEVLKRERIELLHKIIEILEPEDRYMLEYSYGLGKNKKMTYEEIGEKFGLKKRQVEHRVRKTLRIIKKIMEDKVG